MAHPTIVRVYDAGEETVREASGAEVQVPFIVMEFVEGRPLNEIVAEGPVVPDEAARIVEGILTALEFSHRAGVVHRDIKPANVMITHSGQVKVMDFGIARAITDTSATVAQTTSILGTASYFSPEQARGETVDARTDLYSTGIVLFELLTGRPPFLGASPSPSRTSTSASSPCPVDDHLDGVPGTRRRDAARPREGPQPSLPERGGVPSRPAAGSRRSRAHLVEEGRRCRRRRTPPCSSREPARRRESGRRVPRTGRHPGAPAPAHADRPPVAWNLARHRPDRRGHRGRRLLRREPRAGQGAGQLLGQGAERLWQSTAKRARPCGNAG